MIMGLRLKPGVRLGGLCPEIAVAMVVVSGVFADEGEDAVVTSASDGVHSRRSFHYSGSAFDCRIRHIPDTGGKWEWITKKIQQSLGTDFEVLLERKNAHIHIEYQPLR